MKRLRKILSTIIAAALFVTPVTISAQGDSRDNPPPDSVNYTYQTGDDTSLYGMIDTTKPVLTGITLSKAEVEAPGSVVVEATATDDISGIDSIWVSFQKENRYFNFFLYNEYRNDQGEQITLEPGHFRGVFEVGQYQLPGEYVLEEVSVGDKAGNSQRYYKNPDEYDLENGVKKLEFDRSIKVINNGDTMDYTTTTANPNLATDIANQPDDAIIGIDYNSNPTLSSDVFDAIKGTNKKLILEQEGIQWVFNGSDITNTKPINLNVDINRIDAAGGQNQEDIAKLVKDNPTVVLSFADNGQLPGKATIRVKADYALRQYIGSKGLTVYYYDNTEKKLISVATDVNVTIDGYLEFTITHNSDYIITPYQNNVNPPMSFSTYNNTASFSQYYVDIITNAGGSVSPGSGFVNSLEQQTYTLTPNAGYVVDKVMLDGIKEIPIVNNCFTLLVDEPYKIEITFKLQDDSAKQEHAIDQSPLETAVNPATGDSWWDYLI